MFAFAALRSSRRSSSEEVSLYPPLRDLHSGVRNAFTMTTRISVEVVGKGSVSMQVYVYHKTKRPGNMAAIRRWEGKVEKGVYGAVPSSAFFAWSFERLLLPLRWS